MQENKKMLSVFYVDAGGSYDKLWSMALIIVRRQFWKAQFYIILLCETTKSDGTALQSLSIRTQITNLHDGAWGDEVGSTVTPIRTQKRNAPVNVYHLSDTLANYLMDKGAVPFQYKVIDFTFFLY